jgi:D-glycero-alpha-D-manno-heptose-7-phosphate kinase
MIISRTPFRISLFGGGSDYPLWYREHGGSVLGFAINRYCYLSLRTLPQFFEHRHRIVYSQVETVRDIEEIQHPAVRCVLREMGCSSGLEIHHDGDLPARSGLGSSSSFTVGLLNALKAMDGQMVSKEWLAKEAIRIEQDVIGENVGSQDQVWAAYGGLNRIDFQPNNDFSVRSMKMTAERRSEFLGNFMLFFTGLSRYATEVAGKKIANLRSRAASMHTMVQMVDEAQAILSNPGQSFDAIGALLHESWLLKRGLADAVSSDRIDEIYQAGRDAGAIGGKLLGAGGGGFMLFYVKPDLQKKVAEKLSPLVNVQFSIDDVGSRIVVYEPNGLQSR